MTQDEIQAVARAMCLEGGFNPDEIMPNDGPRWCYYVGGAQAAISALAAIAALDAARGDRVAQVVEWLRKENGLCDCHARCETECGCGAWDDWKTKPLLEIADAIERGEPFNG